MVITATRISVRLLLFFLGACFCLELDEMGKTLDLWNGHKHVSISLPPQVLSASTAEMDQSSSALTKTDASSLAVMGMETSSASIAMLPSLTATAEKQQSTDMIQSSPSSSQLSLLATASSSTAPLVTPSVEQLLRIFNNTDTPPDHFLKGVKKHWKWPLKRCYRRRKHGVTLSMYWIPKEGEWDESEDGKHILLNNGGSETLLPLLDPNDHAVANVTGHLWSKCRMEGTCLLQNGDLINLAQGHTDRFVVIGKKHRRQNIFGWGAGLQNLRPYISVAANDIPLGTTLYVRELDGLELGNEQVHNGCVSVDDDGWSFGRCQLDFFVVSYVDYLWLDRELDLDRVTVIPRKCKLLNYSTIDHLKYMHADIQTETLSMVMNDTMVLPNDTLSALVA